MKKLIFYLIVLCFFSTGCQEKDNDESKVAKNKNIETEAQVVNSSSTLDVVDVVNNFGGDTFDPELQIKVNSEGFFDKNTDISIVEEGENIFVIWQTRNGFLEKPIINGSIAKNGNWEVTNKTLYNDSFYKLDNIFLLNLRELGTWKEPQKQISISKLTNDGTFTEEEVLTTVPIVNNLDIIPSSHGRVVIFRSDNSSDNKTITYNILPIEDESLGVHSITYKYFPEGGITEPNYIDFRNKYLYGMGKKSDGLLKVLLKDGEPLYDNNGKEKIANIGEPIHISSNKKGEIEVYSNNDHYLQKQVFDKNLELKSEEIIGQENKHITFKDDMLHYWEVTLYKNRPSLNLTKLKN